MLIINSVQDLQNILSFKRCSNFKFPLALEIYQLAKETLKESEKGIKQGNIILYCFR